MSLWLTVPDPQEIVPQEVEVVEDEKPGEVLAEALSNPKTQAEIILASLRDLKPAESPCDAVVKPSHQILTQARVDRTADVLGKAWDAALDDLEGADKTNRYAALRTARLAIDTMAGFFNVVGIKQHVLIAPTVTINNNRFTLPNSGNG